MKTPIIELPELAQSESPAYQNLNDGFRALDAIVQLTVSSRRSIPPDTPEQGDRYIVTAGPSGDWIGHERHVAYKTAAGWDFRTPRRGWTAVVLDETIDDKVVKYFFNGTTWIPLVMPASAVSVALLGSPTAYANLDVEFGRVQAALAALVLNDLVDVDVVSNPPTDGQALVWSSTNSLWLPGSVAGGSGGNITPDTHPASADVADDEFESASFDTAGTRFSGATPWAWRNQSTSSAAQGSGAVTLSIPSSASDSLRVVEQSLPGGNWRYRCKFVMGNFSPTNFCQVGMCVVRSSNGRILSINKAYSTGTKLEANYWSSVTAFGSNLASSDIFGTGRRSWVDPFYFELEYDGTNVIFRYSDYGATGSFIQLASRAVATDLGAAPDKIGLFLSNANSTASFAVFDWFRRMA